MFTHIRMKNFKSWKDSGEVKLAPLTGFFGTNSSGKSSLLQMLLLLKQTIGTDEVLFFGDENSLVNLGNFGAVVHNHDRTKSLELEFGCQFPDSFMVRVSGTSVSINSFTFDTVIGTGTHGVNHLRYRFKFQSNPAWEVSWNKSNRERRSSPEKRNCYGKELPLPISSSGNPKNFSLIDFSQRFEKLFDRVYFLGPTRVHPQRSYHWEGTHPESIGQLGDRTIDALLSSRVNQLTTPHEGRDIPIEKRISAWLQEMELAYSFSLKRSERDYRVRIQRSPDSAEVALADMGYGLSQFLPVLVLCYYVPEGSALILEQPGMHLHPKVQSQLADLLIEVVTERNLQVLVESHSEHLLNRLQRRVAEEKIGADQTAVYFCQNDKGVSTIEHLEMDELGNIKNWPPNFFGDEMGDLFAMTEAQMERQKKMEDE